MNRNFVFFILSSAFVALFSACYSGSTPSQNQLDVTLTSHEPSFSFNTATTYALPSQVVAIADPSASPSPVDPSLSQTALQTISQQLNSRGYTQVTGSQKPSMFFEVSTMQTQYTQYYYSYWYGYYGGYYAPYYPYVGAGWAPYPVGYVSTSTLGSLIINATDPNNPNTTTKQIPSVWTAVVNGAINGSSTADVQSRVVDGINTAFSQSPYLTRVAP